MLPILRNTLPHGRISRPILLVQILVGLGSIGAIWAVMAHRMKSPEVVRRQMHADLRAGRLAACCAAIAWLEREDRLTSQDWMVHARVAHLEGRPDQALACLNRIDDQDPMAAQARLMAGVIELQRHRARPAEIALRKVIQRDPGQIAARLELIQLYSRQQRFPELDAQFEALADRDLLDFDHLRFWFMTRNVPWEVKDDLEPLRRSVEADPEDVQSHRALAEGLRRLGRADEAEKVLEGIPDSDAATRGLRARLAIDRGDLERAERILAKDQAGDVELARLHGQLALRHGDGPAAVRWFRQAYASKPDDRATLVGLATSLKRAGKAAEAAPFEAQARRFDEFGTLIGRISAAQAASDSDLHRRLGSICEALGRRSEARAWYYLAIACNPLDAEAQQAFFRLKQPVARP